MMISETAHSTQQEFNTGYVVLTSYRHHPTRKLYQMYLAIVRK